MQAIKSDRMRRFRHWLRRLTTFDVLNGIFMILLSFIMLYHFWYMFSVSVTHADYITDVVLWPRDVGFGAYSFVFRLPKVYLGYLNSLYYTVLGLAISMTLTVLGAYALSKKWLPGVRVLLFLVLFTMYFGGGMIPVYLLVNELGFINKVWAIVLPGAVNTYNLIVMRTYFLNSIPQEVEESCRIDGAGEFRTLFSIYLPLSAPILATIALFYFVASWNSWFSAFLYLDNEKMYPIQLVLRESMAGNGLNASLTEAQRAMLNDRTSPKSLDYALTIAVVAPIFVIFPFCQKFFVKGVMVGSIKG